MNFIVLPSDFVSRAVSVSGTQNNEELVDFYIKTLIYTVASNHLCPRQVLLISNIESRES